MRMNRTTSRTGQPLTNEQLYKAAPSVFATQPYNEMSDKYAFVPTIDVIEAMRAEGFLPVAAMQSRTRVEEKRGFTKHQIRFRDFRNGDAPAIVTLGTVFPELVWTNSHAGESSATVAAGLFRLICTNGAVASDATIPGVSVRHTGNAARIIDASYEIVGQMPKLIEAVESWQRISLDAPASRAFASAALQLRYEGETAPVTADQILQPRRREDVQPTLWNVWNRVQESLISGGVRGRNAETGRRLRTRAVEGISENTSLNKNLWALGEEMARLLS